jgi:hypothetical protein
MSRLHAAWRPMRTRAGLSVVIVSLGLGVVAPATVSAVRSAALSARAAKAPADLDHVRCYFARQQPDVTRAAVDLKDQFGTTKVRVAQTAELCNPVSKNGSKILHPRAHLVCYETSEAGTEPFKQRKVRVTNQFGRRELLVVAPATLCVPSLKSTGTEPLPGSASSATKVLDHFRCYDVKVLSAPKSVHLKDQFRSTTTKVGRLVSLCLPVSKNREPVRRPKSHLVCYTITEKPFGSLAVRVRNQFGLASLKVVRPQALCLPSFKTVITTARTG